MCFICSVVFVISLTDWIDLPEYTSFKGLMFGFLGISNFIPAIFIFYMIVASSDANDHLNFGIEIILILGMGVTYLTGLAFYIKKFPEKKNPVKFDIWFHSHTIFHIFVFFAALEHFFALKYLYNKRRHMDCYWCKI